ncbi:hypothetical protein HQ590_02640 [bacterium]|nr:hypothetical protein [bacterium]
MNSAVRSKSGNLRVLVLGYLVRGPIAGMAWHHLQYAMGLQALGHDVWFLEDSGDTPYCCYDPSRHVNDADPTYGMGFAAESFSRVGLPERWAYYDAHTSRWLGPAAARAPEICAHSDLLLNLSCSNPIRPWLRQVPVRALIDTDPAFTQIRILTDPGRRELAEQHTVFFSFGENIGQPGCEVPADGFPWQPTRQPVVPEAWPVAPAPAAGKFTTVMQWDSYQTREYQGRRYGMKSQSLNPLLDLPRLTPGPFEVAIGRSAGSKQLRDHGWSTVDPLPVSRSLQSYQQYLQCSKAEFSVAKHGYVSTRSGWFSERSACYLASGRPVVVEDTGFTRWLNVDAGVCPFRDRAEAVAAVEDIQRRYRDHCRAARAIAEETFHAGRVLEHLVTRAMQPPARVRP